MREEKRRRLLPQPDLSAPGVTASGGCRATLQASRQPGLLENIACGLGRRVCSSSMSRHR